MKVESSFDVIGVLAYFSGSIAISNDIFFFVCLINSNALQAFLCFHSLLGEKRKELGDAADKLRNGLFKIDETSVKVESMSVELEIAKGKGQLYVASI